MSYEIEFAKLAAKQFKDLSIQDQQRIKLKIDALAIEPRPNGVVKLVAEKDLYRIRVGDYRIIYTVFDNILLVLVVKIAHRKDVYR